MSEPSKDTHVFVGMFRPTKQEVFQRLAYKAREDGIPLSFPVWHNCCVTWPGFDFDKRFNELYLEGLWDEPVYKTIEEYIRIKESKAE